MGDFTITYTPEDRDLYLYPNASSTTQMIANDGTQNWECVDEDRNIPDISTYVYTTNQSHVADLFTLPNHTTETGTINSVRVFARAKSNTYTQGSSGTYEILIKLWSSPTYSHSEASYGDPIAPLGTGYRTYNCVWTSSPSTNDTWTWEDIDNLVIGIMANSPTIGVPNTTATFRPTGSGAFGAYSGEVPTGEEHWKCVDNSTPSTDYIFSANDTTETFTMEDHTTQSGTIEKVTFYRRCSTDIVLGTYTGAYIVIAGNNHNAGDGTYPDVFPNWTTTAYTLTSQPSDSSNWDWTTIDQTEAGLACSGAGGSGDKSYCEQIYMIVTYAADHNPEIRTTQCYAKVNYTPTSDSLSLRKPNNYQINNSREIKKINFWNENRAIYDVQRKNKTLSMSGTETGTTAQTNMETMSDVAEEGAMITLSGFDDPNINTDWMIISFDYNENAKAIYEWNLEAEKA